MGYPLRGAPPRPLVTPTFFDHPLLTPHASHRRLIRRGTPTKVVPETGEFSNIRTVGPEVGDRGPQEGEHGGDSEDHEAVVDSEEAAEEEIYDHFSPASDEPNHLLSNQFETAIDANNKIDIEADQPQGGEATGEEEEERGKDGEDHEGDEDTVEAEEDVEEDEDEGQKDEYVSMQGTRQNKPAEDILWVGEYNKEGSFICKFDANNYFFKWTQEGFPTIWVRTSVDALVGHVARLVLKFYAEVHGKPEGWVDETCCITFQGKHLTGREKLSNFPLKSMILMSKNSLPEELQNHQGYLWECVKCHSSDSQRNNIIQRKSKKCKKHKFLFASDQPFNKLGDPNKDDGPKPMHAP